MKWKDYVFSIDGREVVVRAVSKKHANYRLQMRTAREQILKTEEELKAAGYVNTIHDCWELPPDSK